MIAGLQRATFGGVVVDGTEVTEPGAERAIVFQSPCLLPWLTARQNVVLAAARRRETPTAQQREAADHYLELVGVADNANQLPGQLSLGTQRCVSLARALSTEPRFLLLDEPFSQLDFAHPVRAAGHPAPRLRRNSQDRGDGDARCRRGAVPRG